MTNESNDEQEVLFSVRDGVATVSLNRPKQRNAITRAGNARLFDLWETIDADPSIRAVILTSADCGTFCAGMDLKEAARVRAETGKDIIDLLRDPFFLRMRSVNCPIIAAMTGDFTAAGMILAASSDLRVGLAGKHGGIAEARVGRGTAWAASMVASLPLAVLMEMIVTAEKVPVETLRGFGFLNYVEATPDGVRERAEQLARTICRNAPLSVNVGKRGLLESVAKGAELGFEVSKGLHQAVYYSDDAIEGPRAFTESRAPRWTGR